VPQNHPAPDWTSDGQREFLASLTPEQRARFDGMSANEKIRILGPHADHFEPDLADFQRRTELKSVAKSIPATPAPQSTVEHIAQLPQLDPKSADALADKLEREFRDRKHSACYRALAYATWRGNLDPDLFAELYELARKPSVPKPGAYLWTSFRKRLGIDWAELERRAYPGRTAARSASQGKSRGGKP